MFTYIYIFFSLCFFLFNLILLIKLHVIIFYTFSASIFIILCTLLRNKLNNTKIINIMIFLYLLIIVFWADITFIVVSSNYLEVLFTGKSLIFGI